MPTNLSAARPTSPVGSGNDSFLDAIDLFRNNWPILFESDQKVHEVRAAIKNRFIGRSPIDYSTGSLAFNRAYFLKNLLKNLTNYGYALSTGILEPFFSRRRLQVVDIGSGAGTATLAWNYLAKGLSHDFRLLDRSDAQLELAMKISELFQFDFAAEIMNFPSPRRRQADIQLVSYWLCEQDLSDHALLLNSFQKPSILTDYADVLASVCKQLSSTHSFMLWSLTCAVPYGARQYLEDTHFEVHGAFIAPK